MLKNALNPTFGKMQLDEITVDDVNVWHETVVPGRESPIGTG